MQFYSLFSFVFCLLTSLVFKNFPQLLVAQFTDPIFTGGNSHVGEMFFLLDHIVDFLLECVFCDEPVNHHIFLLSDFIRRIMNGDVTFRNLLTALSSLKT